MSKLYRIDLNVDTVNVVPNLLINKTEQLEGGGFGEYTPAEFAKNIFMQAISMAHPVGNLASLRRTQKIAEKFDHAIKDKEGFLDLDDADHKYILSSMDKADQWNNSLEIANSITIVYDAIVKAQVVE